MSKVIFLLGDATEQGGIEKVTLNLADELSKEKSIEQVEVLSLYKKNQTISFPVDKVKINYISRSYEVSMYNRQLGAVRGLMFDFFYVIRKSFRVNFFLKYNKFDTFVVPDVKTLLMVILATLFKSSRIISVEHFEYDIPSKPIKILRKLLYRLERVKVITQTDEDYLKYSWINEKKIKIIPNMVNVLTRNVVERKNKVIAIGRFCHQKGFDLLIDAWASIPEESRLGWHLEIYGQGDDADILVRQIDSNNIKGVQLLPFTKNIDDIYSEAKVFVLSSRFEGLGMVLIEALAHKLPCISYACPAGPRTIIKNNYNGILVEPENIKELGRSIEMLIKNESLREHLSSNAINSIHKFSKSVVTDKWVDVINEG